MAKKQMAIFNEKGIKKLFDNNLVESKANLKNINIFGGIEPDFPGLTGWVFEKTIRYCIMKELKIRGLDIEEQVCLDGRYKVDLKIGDVVIEIKETGCWGFQGKKYKSYYEKARNKKLKYVFLSLDEGEKRYYDELIKQLGKPNAFYLFLKGNPLKGEWNRFITSLKADMK